MNRAYNFITADSANVPLIAQPGGGALAYGEFTPYSMEPGSQFGPVKTRDMFLPNFSIRTFEGTMDQDTVFYDREDKGLEMLGSCIFFKGQVTTHVPGKKDTGIISHNRSQNFKFDPNNELRHRCNAEMDLNFIHISYMPRFFNELLPDNEAWADNLRSRIDRKERIVGDHFSSISLAQEQALSNIFNTPLTGKLGYMMIETSMIQVILLQMYSLFYKEEAYKTPAVGKRDVEIAHGLKEHLDRTFLDDHSITGLAQHFCTNTNKLMSLFKKVFGKSIFEYITEQRMEHARRLLAEDGLLVVEVARNIGYKNPNHFSTAFKKKFGVNPSVYR